MTDLWLVPLELREEQGLLVWLGERLSAMYGVTGRIFERPLDVDACRNRKRNQLDTRALLGMLLQIPEPGFVMGVTSEDLFLSIFTFVIGEAMLGGRAAMVSCHRLHPESYGLAPDPELFRSRLLKESVHELGHCHGLVHCLDPDCVMHASSTAEDVDQKQGEPCMKCLATIGRVPSMKPGGKRPRTR
jgi:archaemetzincin